MDPKKSRKKTEPNKSIKLSFTGLRKFFECPRCFWYMMHGYKRPPLSLPGILGTRDAKIKKYYDYWRKEGLPPILRDKKELKGLALVNQELANKMRKGIEYFDTKFNAILWGKLDDCFYDSEKKLYIPLDNKSRGKFTKETHPMDKFQLDVYTFLTEKQKLRVDNRSFLIAYADSEGFQIHEPGAWRVDIKIIKTDPEKAKQIFNEAVKTINGEKPEPSKDCKFCHFMKNAKEQIRKHNESYLGEQNEKQ